MLLFRNRHVRRGHEIIRLIQSVKSYRRAQRSRRHQVWRHIAAANIKMNKGVEAVSLLRCRKVHSDMMI